VTLYGSDDSYPRFNLAEFRRTLLDAKNELVARGFPDLPV
jgi:hypothetical protein